MRCASWTWNGKISLSPLIEIKDLTVTYGKKRALDGLTLDFELGSFVGLLGPNGSGKSTLLRVLAGLDYTYKGEVLIDKQAPGAHTKLLVSYLPDRPAFPLDYSVRDILGHYRHFFYDFNEKRALGLINHLEIDTTKLVRDLSKGMLERLLLILTISRNASVYLFDEPLSGVDPRTREVVLETVVKEYASDALFIMSTHLISEIEFLFDQVLFLDEGKARIFGAADDLRETYGMSIDEIARRQFT